MCFFTKPRFSQRIAHSFKARFANSIAMLEITKEGADGCDCYCKPDFHRPSRAWHFGGKFSNRAPAVAAVPEWSGLCCQPGAEAGCEQCRCLLQGPRRLWHHQEPSPRSLGWCWAVQAWLWGSPGSFGGRGSVVCPPREVVTAQKKVEEKGGVWLTPSSVPPAERNPMSAQCS